MALSSNSVPLFMLQLRLLASTLSSISEHTAFYQPILFSIGTDRHLTLD